MDLSVRQSETSIGKVGTGWLDWQEKNGIQLELIINI